MILPKEEMLGKTTPCCTIESRGERSLESLLHKRPTTGTAAGLMWYTVADHIPDLWLSGGKNVGQERPYEGLLAIVGTHSDPSASSPESGFAW